MNAEYPDTFELIQTLIKKVLHNAAHNEIVLQTVLFVQITIRQRWQKASLFSAADPVKQNKTNYLPCNSGG